MRQRPIKTLLMLLLERDHHNTIEEVMLDAFRQHGTERGAAAAIGITQQSFNVWKYRLGLDDQIETIRQSRLKRVSEA